MTITISQQTFDELLYQETENSSQYPDPDDQLDVIYDYPKVLGQGYWREIKLREGLGLSIGDLRMSDRVIFKEPETEHHLHYHFHFSGGHEDKYTSIGSRQYIFHGSGLTPELKSQAYHEQPFLEVEFTMQPDVLRSFAGNSEGELPKQLQHLIRPCEQYYHRCGAATLPMQRIAQQILHCPYRGIAKRMYLEGKVLELMGILIGQEIEILDGKSNIQPSLQPDVVDRIHHAREIILQRLDNPLSLNELARQVGLNECTLKRGFRYCFNTTVFGYLRNYKLEQARQLLEAGEMKITEIAHAMGYTSRSPFAAAFRKQFGMNPKEYQKLGKNSV